MTSPKITTAIAEYEKSHDEAWLSFEFFPPKTDAGVASLYKVAEKLKSESPVFVDITWGAGGNTSELTFTLAATMKEKTGLNPNMHLTCTNMEKQKVIDALNDCKNVGITNIVALRGDPPAGQEAWEITEGGFSCALDLVKFIRAEHGDYFCLSVAGYPEGHPNSMTTVNDTTTLTPSELGRCARTINDDGVEEITVCRDADFEKEMIYLKEKVDAGADIIITQLFFDTEVFLTFVRRCRDMGINVPIVPGIMCATSAGGFKRMTKFCKTRVTQDLWDRVNKLEKDEDMKPLGIEYITQMCKTLLDAGTKGLHFYTLNSSVASREIVNNLRKLSYKIGTLIEQQTETVFDATVSAAVA